MSDDAVTRSEFARLQGWSPSYVTKLASQGRLVLTDDGKQVRVAASLARIKATEDPARNDVAQRHAQARGAGEAPPPAPVEDRVGSSYQASRAVKERYAALTAKAEYEKLVGNLVEVSEVRAAASEAGALIRAQIENLPAQLAPELAAETDEARVQALLVERMEILLGNIAELIERAAG